MTNLIEKLNEQLMDCPCSLDNTCDKCLDIIETLKTLEDE